MTDLLKLSQLEAVWTLYDSVRFDIFIIYPNLSDWWMQEPCLVFDDPFPPDRSSISQKTPFLFSLIFWVDLREDFWRDMFIRFVMNPMFLQLLGFVSAGGDLTEVRVGALDRLGCSLFEMGSAFVVKMLGLFQGLRPGSSHSSGCLI